MGLYNVYGHIQSFFWGRQPSIKWRQPYIVPKNLLKNAIKLKENFVQRRITCLKCFYVGPPLLSYCSVSGGSSSVVCTWRHLPCKPNYSNFKGHLGYFGKILGLASSLPVIETFSLFLARIDANKQQKDESFMYRLIFLFVAVFFLGKC